MAAKSLKPVAALALVLVAAACAFAREDEAPRPTHAKLPRQFANFSADDVLGRVFDGYDPRTGRVAGLLNDEKKPTLARIREARAWNARGREQLVVLVDLARSDYDFQDLCGNCAMQSLLAVLNREGTMLSLVARQDVPASSDFEEASPASNESPPDEPFAPFIISGHDTSVRLDLAPYRLSNGETLLGIRREHMWLPAQDYSTSLALYRVEGARLREVLYAQVVERDYQRDTLKGSPLLKTTSLVSTRNNGGEFYDLFLEKTTVRCVIPDDDADCGPSRGTASVVKSMTEVWSFDGKSFQRTDRRAPPRGRAKATRR
jgi:hypothetical protein